jgi:hypothetical protein
MNDDLQFDERRSEAWRAAIVEHARSGGRRSGPKRAVIVGLVFAAVAVSGGGVAFALSAHVEQASVVASSTPTPIERDTPSFTFTPTPTPTPEPTEDPELIARRDAVQACTSLSSALDGNGNILSADAWSAALESAQRSATAAAEQSPSFAAFEADVSTLQRTPLPGPSATDAEKNAYFNAYLPVASGCWPLGVHLSTD